MVCYNRKPRLRLAFFLRFSSASNAASSDVLDVGVGMNNPNLNVLLQNQMSVLVKEMLVRHCP